MFFKFVSETIFKKVRINFISFLLLVFFHRFKFRATNIKGQFTDSDYSDPVKTLGKKTVIY